MSNTSATGGYLLSTPTRDFGNLSFEEFIQTVFVGLSGLQGSLVRPKWQRNPPPEPDVGVNWLSIGVTEDDADTFAYVGIQPDHQTQLKRMEALTVQCSFYGPQALEYGKAVRDGFQIRQNLETLQRVLMTFAYSSRLIRVPDFVNERWVDRWEMEVHLRREIIRTYPILTLLSSSGILTVNNQGTHVKSVPV